MVEICGKRYIIDYCVSTIKKKKEQEVYRTYVTDALKAIVSNTTGESRSTMTSRFTDMVAPKRKVEKAQELKIPPEERAKDIIARIKRATTHGHI